MSGGGAIWVGSTLRGDPGADRSNQQALTPTLPWPARTQTQSRSARVSGWQRTRRLGHSPRSPRRPDPRDPDPLSGSAAQCGRVRVGRAIWVARYDTATVELDARTGRTISRAHVGNGPAALALGAGAVWVANSLDGTVSEIGAAKAAVLATIPVGSGPRPWSRTQDLCGSRTSTPATSRASNPRPPRGRQPQLTSKTRRRQLNFGTAATVGRRRCARQHPPWRHPHAAGDGPIQLGRSGVLRHRRTAPVHGVGVRHAGHLRARRGSRRTTAGPGPRARTPGRDRRRHDVCLPAPSGDPLLRRAAAASTRFPPRDRASFPGRLSRQRLLRARRRRRGMRAGAPRAAICPAGSGPTMRPGRSSFTSSRPIPISRSN